MKPDAPDLDAELDRAIVLKARDGLARARSRLIKAEGGEARAAAEKSVAVWDALLKKALAAPHEARASAQERATMWAALRHHTDVAEEQGRVLQQVLAGQQQLSAAFDGDQQARKGDKKAIGEMIEAKRLLDHINTDPSAVALSTLARHRQQDIEKEKADAERATKKWEAQRQKIEAEIARQQKVLDEFNYQHDVESNPVRKRALTKHLSKVMSVSMALMDRLGEHLDARPN